MPEKQNNIEKQPDLNKVTMQMISGAAIPWKKSKEQVWSELEKRMESRENQGRIVLFRSWVNIAAAAVIAMLIGTSAVMQLYTKTVRIPAGLHGSIILPDNSSVRINAQSVLSYKPLLWRFNRNVKFEGEAFFEIQKGKKFTVISDIGKTVVLGTSFNVYSRNDHYQVTCISGSVKVMEKMNRGEVILNAGQKAELGSKGALQVLSDINTEQTVSWLANRFSFTSAPAKQVFEEIARQYNITITVQGIIKKTYTGTFNKSASADDILNLVCRPLDLTYIRKSQNEYIISESN